jgi:hypothetical protein
VCVCVCVCFSHSLYITRAPRILVICVLLVIRVLPCLACVTLMRADRGGALHKCRIGGSPKRGGCFEEIQPFLEHSGGFQRGCGSAIDFPMDAAAAGFMTLPSVSVVSSA